MNLPQIYADKRGFGKEAPLGEGISTSEIAGTWERVA